MSLEKLNFETLREMYKACKELFEYYIGERWWMKYCPLCGVTADTYKSCNGCVWVLIEGCTCLDFAIREGFASGTKEYNEVYRLREERNPKWVEIRVSMLAQWLLKLRHMMEIKEQEKFQEETEDEN